MELRSTPDRANPIVLKLRNSGLIPADCEVPPSTVIIIPLLIQHATVERIFDLRQLRTQRWLTAFLPKGDDMLSMPMAKSLDSFSQMLPSLTYWERGGSDLTDALGKYLRRKGANGLVFPSARSDVKCEFLHGNLESFRGWNFVDYRGTRPLSDVVRDYSSWENRALAEGIKIVSAPDDHPYAYSWRIEGKEAAEASLRERKLKKFYDS